ncbi:MAG: NF038143 family protein [Desulfobacterales bacterium]|nr:NF038143 family protein [Desulfobacterales bacterium]
MSSLEAKKEFVWKHEQQFAYTLAANVLDKPKATVWMILIPIILVYHMYRHKKYVEGRRMFAENYSKTPQNLLDKVYLAIKKGADVDFDDVIRHSGLSKDVYKPYRQWLAVLAAHYEDLLHADGDNMETLIRSAYKNRSAYLLFLNQLKTVEKKYYAALTPLLAKEDPAVGKTVAKIERQSEFIRREFAEKTFP